MECLHEDDGWATLHYLLSPKPAKDAIVPKAEVAELSKLRKAALQALKQGHSCTVESHRTKQRHGTVHGDMHLWNVLARRCTGTAWEVQFVDFGWSGLDKISR